MVPPPRLELGRPKAQDFKSCVYYQFHHEGISIIQWHYLLVLSPCHQQGFIHIEYQSTCSSQVQYILNRTHTNELCIVSSKFEFLPEIHNQWRTYIVEAMKWITTLKQGLHVFSGCLWCFLNHQLSLVTLAILSAKWIIFLK